MKTTVEVAVFDGAAEAGLEAARRVAAALQQNAELVLGLPAGRTPLDAYAELRRRHATGELDFSHASAFLIDEFLTDEEAVPGRFRRLVTDHLLSGINLNPERTHSLNGSARDPDAECDRYEEELADAGGLGLLLLGVGVNGHIGFNEPGDALIARTHRVRLLESTRRDNAGLFGGDVSRVPHEALSMGIGTILRAERILLVATGAHKAPAVRGMLRGPLTPRLPASFLQLHRRVDVLLDRAAASAL